MRNLLVIITIDGGDELPNSWKGQIWTENLPG